MPFISLILFCLSSFANTKPAMLPEFSTKQAIHNLRYISDDGKVTYYQTKKGELKYSTNYAVESVHKGSLYSQFLVTSSNNNKLILVTENKHPHRKMWNIKNQEIYLGKYMGKKILPMGEGKAPKFHLNDQYISYFDHEQKEIKIANLKNFKNTKTIKMLNQINPYFIPQVFMATPTDVLFTDINTKGYSALLMYSTVKSSFETIYKSKKPGQKLEVCYYKEYILIGEFPYNSSTSRSTISKVPLYNNKSFANQKIIYSSKRSDIGNMVCDKDAVYFIQNIRLLNNSDIPKTEIVKLTLEKFKVTVQSDFKNVTQLTKLGNIVVTNFKGKFYFVSQQKSLISDEIGKDKR